MKRGKQARKAGYYDKVRLADEFDLSKAKVLKGTGRKITINIPFRTYQDASKIGTKAGTGYQNALKMAMVIGIKELKEKL